MPNNFLPTSYQEFIHLSRYSRWLPKEGRRETWNETVGRYFNFFKEHLKDMTGYELEDKDRKELEKMKKKTRDGIPYYDELPSAADDAADVMSKYDRKR